MQDLLKPYACVRIYQLIQPAESYNGWRVNQRAPKIGDYGTVVDVLTAEGLQDKYIVENCQPDGSSLWLAEFYAEELVIDGGP